MSKVIILVLQLVVQFSKCSTGKIMFRSLLTFLHLRENTEIWTSTTSMVGTAVQQQSDKTSSLSYIFLLKVFFGLL